MYYIRKWNERYPNFKLYKMIARTVHKHTPEKQLEFDFFNQYMANEIDSDVIVMDIDKIEKIIQIKDLNLYLLNK